jgi:hypothetical protein
MSVRKWHVSEALTSFARLNELIGELTEEEVLACLELEAGSNRRGTVIDRLISRAARLNELSYVKKLKEKYHGPLYR